MELLIKIEKDLEGIKRILLEDDIVGRGSILFKEASSLGFKEKCYYCLITGRDDLCHRAKELLKDKVKIIEGKEKQHVLDKIKNEEETAQEGFGAIFG